MEWPVLNRPPVAGFEVTRDSGRITILAANTLDKPQAVRLRLEGIGYTGKAIVLFKKREVEVKNGAIEETIGAFGTRAYVVPVGK